MERLGPEDVSAPEIDETTGAPVVLRGGVPGAEVTRARRARIVLTTYGFSRRGISLVEMTAIVLATPRRNGMRQILGRITRRGSDEKILRLVVDIKDVRTALRGQNTDRRKIYKEKNYPIYRIRVGHADLPDNRRPAPPAANEELVWAPPSPPAGDGPPKNPRQV